MKDRALIFFTAAALLASGCQSTHVLVGEKRPPLDPRTVRVYTTAPPQYEEIAMLTSNSSGSWGFTAQQKTTAVVNGFKNEAGSLGANGVLILGIGNLDRMQGLGPMREGQAMAIWVPNQSPVTQEELDKSQVVQECIDECRDSTGKSAAACFDDCTAL